jgi:hypothetical protein
MTFDPESGIATGEVKLISRTDNRMPTFGEPVSRMVGRIMNKPGYELEALIHETGHMLGFDERYEKVIGSNHPGFEYDLMGAGLGKGVDVITMHPQHIEDAARFALGVADGRTLVNQIIRGIQIDSTGTKGSISQFEGKDRTINPEYKSRQSTLHNELTPHFRNQVKAPVHSQRMYWVSPDD